MQLFAVRGGGVQSTGLLISEARTAAKVVDLTAPLSRQNEAASVNVLFRKFGRAGNEEQQIKNPSEGLPGDNAPSFSTVLASSRPEERKDVVVVVMQRGRGHKVSFFFSLDVTIEGT